MFYVCKCPLQYDPYGHVGFRRCSDKKTVILVCDECEAVWLTPAEVEKPNPWLVKPPLYLLPGTEIRVFGEDTAWATMGEIRGSGWEDFITGECKALGEH